MLLPLKAIISKDVRKDGTSLIYFQYCYSSTNRVLLNTEIALPTGYWNTKRQCISKLLPPSSGDHEQLNGDISRMRKVIEILIERADTQGNIHKGQYVKDHFTPLLTIEEVQTTTITAPPSKKKEPDFFQEIEHYIQARSKQVCKSGIANFHDLRNRLLSFQEHRNKNILFKELDFSFYVELVEYLTYDYVLRRRKTTIYGLKVSSIGKTIKQLRMFIKDRVRRKIIPPLDMEDFKIPNEETDAIYLTYEEIGKLYALDLSHDPAMALHRDIFVLGCLSGLRFSDYASLQGSDLRNGMLYKKTSKMDNWVVIPLRKEAAAIFKSRYVKGAPKISNSVFNKYIKDIAVLAGLNQPITFSHKKGNKDIVVTKPKFQWVTSHTCRRSFCTNEYLAGTEINIIMRISGHKTHKDFFKYIRITQEEAAQKIKVIWEARSNMQAFSLPAAG